LYDLNLERNRVGKYKRILLKLSGEVIEGAKDTFDLKTVERIADEIKKVQVLGVEIGIVIGGGNIIRGAALARHGLDRTQSDYMGMLATIINSILLAEILHAKGVPAVLQSALAIDTVAQSIDLGKTKDYLNEKKIVLFGGGTGNPYFTTDTAAALRACEINADVLIKATKVDGVYDKDPELDGEGTLYTTLHYNDLLQRQLRVMDMAAVSMCRDWQIPIVIFNIRRDGALVRITEGENIGTVIAP
jgi:uridylate kinase